MLSLPATRHSAEVAVYFLLLVVMMTAPSVYGQTTLATDPYQPLSAGGKAKVFGKRMIAPSGFAKSAFTAAINQAQDSPEEWGQGAAGYGRRYGHKITNRTIENSIGLLAAIPLRQEPRFFRSGETTLGRRVQHTLMYTLLTRTDSGGRAVSVWRLAGNYGAQFISNAWRPERYTSVSDTLIRGTVSVGYDAASNLLKEFWPDIRKRLFRKP